MKKPTDAEPKTYKLDLTKVLGSFDTRDFNFFEKLTEEEVKAFSPFFLMRWMSVTSDQQGMHAYYLLATNDLINCNFESLYKYPDLQAKLYALIGVGSKQYHQWIKGPSRNSKNPIDEFLKTIYYGRNKLEIQIIKNQLNKESFTDLVKSYGYQEKEIKELVKLWKKGSGNQ